jgi:Flp pilus assembly protein TadG
MRMSSWMKIKRALRLLSRREDGTQLIEFTIAFPFLLLMFAGSVELGRLFYTYTTLTKATVVGTRYLSSKPVGGSGYDPSDIAAAKNLMVCGVAPRSNSSIVSGFDIGNITITPPPSTGNVRYVTVSISYAYTPKVFNLAAMTGIGSLSLNYTLTPRTTMRYMLDSN